MTSLVEREAGGGGVGDGRGWVEKGWQAAVQGGGLWQWGMKFLV